MIDQVKALLLNGRGISGLRRVSDAASDAVMALFGVSGAEVDADADGSVVSRLMPLALAPDLSRFRRFYDPRVTPPGQSSIYRTATDDLSPSGLYDRVLGHEGWWTVTTVFSHADPAVAVVLAEMRSAAMSGDAPYALGAVLLAVAYRRWILQGGGA